MPVVPPGHRVVVFKPAAKPFFARAESGPIMLNFGSAEHVASGLSALAKLTASAVERQSIVWLMAADIVPAFDDAPELLTQVASLVAAGPLVSHLAVFPHPSPATDRVMAAFQRAGVGTQRGAPDGACYVEVRKPDGTIEVGIPGPEID